MTDTNASKAFSMLCSSCSTPIRPLVAIDIDGTLGSYHTHFTEFCEGYFGRRFKLGWNGDGEFEDWLGLTKEDYRDAKLAYRQGGMKRTLRPYHHAAAFVNGIANRAELWIATSRPWQRLDNIDPDTVEWLRRHSLHFDGLIYGDDKYEKLAAAIDPGRIVCVVDDLFEQCERAESLGLVAVQKYGTHNANLRKPIGGGSMIELREIVYDLITKWEIEHEH